MLSHIVLMKAAKALTWMWWTEEKNIYRNVELLKVGSDVQCN